MALQLRSLVVAVLVHLLIRINPTSTSVDIKSEVDCVAGKDFMNLVEWFFRKSEVLFVMDLDDTVQGSGFQNRFLKELFSGKSRNGILKSPEHTIILLQMPRITFPWSTRRSGQPEGRRRQTCPGGSNGSREL